MDVNNINTNINNLNTSPSLPQLDRSSPSNEISKISEDGLELSISSYNQQRDELSINVQSLNEGIAISKIAENGIEKQQEVLNKIKEELKSLASGDIVLNDNNDKKQDINNFLKDFNQSAYETKFNNENLLSVDYYDDAKNIEIITKDETLTIAKANTPQIANDIFDTLNTSNLNKPEDIQRNLDKIETSSNQLQNISDEFTSFGNRLESSALENLREQTDLYNTNANTKQNDFGKDSSDFSKSNVNANLGYLAASQANIVQEQSVRLLS